MADKSFVFNLDLNMSTMAPRIRIRQNDLDTNKFSVQILVNGVPADLTGLTVYFECVTPAGNSVRDAAAVTDAVNGKIEYTVSDKVYATLGWINVAYFVFEQTSGSDVLRMSTDNFTFEVIADALTGNPEQGSYNSDIATMLTQVAQLQADYTTLNPANYATASQLADTSQQVNTLNGFALPHKVDYHDLSVTIGSNLGIGTPSSNDWQHFVKQGLNVTICVMIGINDANDSNPVMPNDSVINQAISDAKLLGVDIDMIKPHLGIDFSDGFDRSNYYPSDVNAFFNNWKTILKHYASICDQNNIPILCVGCEQTQQSLNDYFSNWQEIVSEIKSSYPNLLLTYAAKTGEFDDENRNKIWELMDMCGYNVYLHYTQKSISEETPNINDLAQAFYFSLPDIDVIDNINKKFEELNKPTYITEIGCMPIDTGLISGVPYDYETANTNYDSVKYLIETAFDNLMRNNHVVGFSWWSAGNPFRYFNDDYTTTAEQKMMDYVKGDLI